MSVEEYPQESHQRHFSEKKKYKDFFSEKHARKPFELRKVAFIAFFSAKVWRHFWRKWLFFKKN
ncbi:MAG: hypothetical protein RMJ33_05450 [Saprospiraceae bacterium]|nr:hypothetical protein [Saprospiraceae bacterium]